MIYGLVLGLDFVLTKYFSFGCVLMFTCPFGVWKGFLLLGLFVWIFFRFVVKFCWSGFVGLFVGCGFVGLFVCWCVLSTEYDLVLCVLISSGWLIAWIVLPGGSFIIVLLNLVCHWVSHSGGSFMWLVEVTHLGESFIWVMLEASRL